MKTYGNRATFSPFYRQALRLLGPNALIMIGWFAAVAVAVAFVILVVGPG